ncbi:MAG: permease [Candidatus Contubernalis sp.]|nr:permease [Candidatus Contubernalis sp.]
MLIYSFLIVGLAVSIYKDRNKTKKAVFMGSRIFIKMLPSLLLIVGLVGLILGFIPPDTIGRYMGTEAGFSGTMLAAVFGAITFIPSIVSIPLAGSLLRSGAAVMTIATFITTLTMVGTITAHMEIKELGKRFTLLRNGLSFIFALCIGLIMGVVLL